MPANAEEIFLDAMSLSADERADLIDRLVSHAAENMDPEIERAHLEEIQRRIERVESGVSEMIPGEQVLAECHRLLADLEKKRQDP